MESTARVFSTKYRDVLPFFAAPRPSDILDASWRVADALDDGGILDQGSLKQMVDFLAANSSAVGSLLGNRATLAQGLTVLWEFIIGKLLIQLRNKVTPAPCVCADIMLVCVWLCADLMLVCVCVCALHMQCRDRAAEIYAAEQAQPAGNPSSAAIRAEREQHGDSRQALASLVPRGRREQQAPMPPPPSRKKPKKKSNARKRKRRSDYIRTY
jgi:hypothetical protein